MYPVYASAAQTTPIRRLHPFLHGGWLRSERIKNIFVVVHVIRRKSIYLYVSTDFESKYQTTLDMRPTPNAEAMHVYVGENGSNELALNI